MPGIPKDQCCLPITVRWRRIPSNKENRIYLFASVDNTTWWRPGKGVFLENQTSGDKVIADGSYSEPGQIVILFACLTTETYPAGDNYEGRPTCTLASPDVQMKTQ
jgi:hypothetical protein